MDRRFPVLIYKPPNEAIDTVIGLQLFLKFSSNRKYGLCFDENW